MITMSTRRFLARPSGRVVGIFRFIFRESDDGATCAVDSEAGGEDLHHRDTAGRGQLPIAAEARGVNGTRVGMAFDPQRIFHGVQRVGELSDDGIGGRVDHIGAGGKERGLFQADHQAARLQINLDFAVFDFGLKFGRQAFERWRELDDIVRLELPWRLSGRRRDLSSARCPGLCRPPFRPGF